MFAVRGPLANRRTAEELVHLLIKRGEIDPASYEANDPLSFLTSAGVAKSLSEAAYRFCRHAPGIDVTITGTGNRTHLLENLRSINAGPLPVEAIDRLSASFGNVTSESGQY